MATPAVISLTKIDACGLYSMRRSKFEYGDISSVLADLAQWASNKPLSLTKTYGDDDKLHPCYLYDIYHDQGDWLIATWNETESSGDAVASVDGQALVGQASITSTSLPSNSIPGFPTYFWVLPKEKIVASIKFEYRKTGIQELAHYIKSFLTYYSRYAVTTPTNKGNNLAIEVCGYRQHSSAEILNLCPRFKLKEIHNLGEIDFIKTQVDSITKITNKTTLFVDVPLHKTIWQKLNALINSSTEKTLSKNVHISYDIKDNFSLAEVEDIISEWEENKDEDVWSDRGFYIKGKPYWLRKSIARDTFHLNLVKHGHSVDLAALAKALREQKQNILNLRK